MNRQEASFNYWDRSSLLTRVVDAAQRRRRPASSPDEVEVAAFDDALSGSRLERTLVLGMTPELRRLALQRSRRVVSVDESAEAIALYRAWIDPADRERDVVVQCRWEQIPESIGGKVDAILGDGIFSLLPDLASHRAHLAAFRSQLKPRGKLVIRKCVIPRTFEPLAFEMGELVQRLRAGTLGEDEFGHVVRILGHYNACYDPATFLLDNARVFERCAIAAQSGVLTAAELSLIRGYYYGGPNCILPQGVWEDVLHGCGFQFRVHPCFDKLWYTYFIVYECWA